ncbi:adenosine deaminase [Clostridium sp.]|jgi:adenosine deaminase|uniref:adenosine deaminase n=1 Tax=Clostridium sp. TaxID=1506 RepID=UPI003A5C4C3A
MNLDELLKTIPKTDLHCHLDGSIRPETMIDIALKDSISLPTYEIDKFNDYVKVYGKCPSLKEYLNKFDIPIKVMQSYNNIYRVTYELLEDAAKQNIRYIEIRFAPFNHIENLCPKDVINAALDAMKDGNRDFKIMSNLILCIMRHELPENGEKLVNIAKDFAGSGVAAIDLAGNEEDFPPEIHKKAFKMAEYYGLHRTVHSGETGNAENITKSINLLHAERIGHGIYAFKDSTVISLLKGTKTPLEMCITSNVNTSAVSSYKSHPIKSYLENNINVTVNTDNTTVSNTDIIKEFKYLVKYQNFSLKDIEKVIENGILASFLEKEKKEKLHSEFLKSIKNINQNELI